jgi:hypothetical protein
MPNTSPTLQQLVDDYNAVRTANALGMTVEQVKTVNRIERDYAELEIEQPRPGMPVFISFEDERGFTYSNVLVREDGTLDYKNEIDRKGN